MSTRTWRLLVAAAVATGLAIRLASVLTRPGLAVNGDPYQYLGQANLLVAGHGWIDPFVWQHGHVAAQTAKLPPLYTMLMALCSLVGFKSFFAHRIWSALISSAGVAVAAGLGREVAGRPVGVLTAFGVALYPNLWMSAGLGMSETISPIAVMVVLWLAYRMWRQPSMGRAAGLGVAIGLAGLARDELLVFVALIVVPLAVGVARRARPGDGGVDWRRAGRVAGAGAVGAVAVVAPWVAFNLTRFSQPVLISDRFGVTLASANCDATYRGWSTGWWSMQCAQQSVIGATGDEPARDAVATTKGIDYIGAHLSELPGVEYARLGRTFGFYRVRQQMALDIYIENRPRTWVWVGMWSYYALLLAAPFGLWRLRQRGVPLFPLGAVLADVVLVTVLTYGQTRFRATLEPVLVLLAAVAIAAAVGLVGRDPAAGVGAFPPEEARSAASRVSGGAPLSGAGGGARPGRPAAGTSRSRSGPRSAPRPAAVPPSASGA